MVLGLCATTAPASKMVAQGIRVRGVSTFRLLELRPFVDDSAAFNTTVPGAVDYRLLADGRVVRCVEGDAFCRYKRSGATATAIPYVQDLQLTGWGLGRGVSIIADVRLRAAMGSAPALWPRAEDAFDALAAYVQLDRSRFTARVGRQYATSGFGVYNFDGASLTWRAHRRLTAEAFGGWSLAQGLNESFTSSEIAAVDELAPDRNAFLLGAQVRVRPTERSSISARYQRELRVNRSALYSERVALDGSWNFGRASLDGSFEQNLSASVVNEFRVRMRLPPVAQTTLSLEARHFRPFFELWTIWGAFAPVGFDEVRTQASWRTPTRALSIDVHGAYRKWEATDAGLDFAPLRNEGWRLGGVANWRVATHWNTNASYSADIGFGAARTEGDVGVHWDHGRVFLGANVSAFQSIYEFRIGTGRVFGAGVDAGWQINPDLRLVGDAAVYQQRAFNGAPSNDWTQHRGTLRFEWRIGSDPGAQSVTSAANKAQARLRGEAELKRVAVLYQNRLPATAGIPEPPQ